MSPVKPRKRPVEVVTPGPAFHELLGDPGGPDAPNWSKLSADLRALGDRIDDAVARECRS